MVMRVLWVGGFHGNESVVGWWVSSYQKCFVWSVFQMMKICVCVCVGGGG